MASAAMQDHRLLVVDDDELIHNSLAMVLPKNWSIHSVRKLADLPSRGNFTAAFVDMHLTPQSSAEGLSALKSLAEQFPRLSLFAISGDLTMDLMEKALEAGALRFLAKPLVPEEVLRTIDKVEAHWSLQQRQRSGQEGPVWLGSSPASQNVLRQISQLKGEPGPLLIEGETGSGKEVVAHLLRTQERSRPWIAVNIAALPENLFESEFFGHVRGAFTGADHLKVGLAEAAHQGDLFIDEIEALPRAHQAKLLRFLESGEVRRVGAKDTMVVKVRVLAATNRSLEAMVKAGEFREDLFFRLAGRRVTLPPLRDRLQDLPELTRAFLSDTRQQTSRTLSPQALELLRSYSWPGNVRELKRICEHLQLTAPLPIIRAEDVLPLLQSPGDGPALKIVLEKGLGPLTEEFEASVLRMALDRKAGDVDEAAALLKISRSNFYKKMKDFGIEGGT